MCVCCINCICRCMSYLHLYFIWQPISQSLANLSDWQLLHHVTDPNAHLVLHDIIQQLRQLRGGAFWEIREEREDLGFDYTAYFDLFCMFHSVVVFPEVLWSIFWRLSMLSWVKIAEAEEEKKKAQDADGRRMQWFCRWTRVDGRNPAPVDMVNIPVFTGFHTSQVVQDFFHQ